MPDKIFDKVILPVFGNEDNSFMGITTLDGERNWVTQLDKYKRKTGKDIFKFIRHGPCDACVDAGVGPKCPHYERAPWKSKVSFYPCLESVVFFYIVRAFLLPMSTPSECEFKTPSSARTHTQAKADDVREIYKQRGQEELGEQEMGGQVISKNTYLIKPLYIKQLNERDLHVFSVPPSVIPVAIDPHGGGKTSRTAIIFIAHDCGKIVVSVSRNHVLVFHGHDKINGRPKCFVLCRLGSFSVCLSSQKKCVK
jgi:hypothetical protein